MKAFVILGLIGLGLAGVAQGQQAHDHGQHGALVEASPSVPSQGGEAAFAAIQEVIGILGQDPATDWSKVDIEALRLHLVDMSNLTLKSSVQTVTQGRTVSFSVTAQNEFVPSIRRMTAAHASMMNGVEGWRYEQASINGGVLLRVTPPEEQGLVKLRALGFVGLMAQGMHHQQHHLSIARGLSPHP